MWSAASRARPSRSRLSPSPTGTGRAATTSSGSRPRPMKRSRPASCSATTAKHSSPTPLPTASPDRVEWCQTPFDAWSAAEVPALAFVVGAEDVLGYEPLVDTVGPVGDPQRAGRSDEQPSALQSLMRTSYAVF